MRVRGVVKRELHCPLREHSVENKQNYTRTDKHEDINEIHTEERLNKPIASCSIGYEWGSMNIKRRGSKQNSRVQGKLFEGNDYTRKNKEELLYAKDRLVLEGEDGVG